jgi:hypothetical protein
MKSCTKVQNFVDEWGRVCVEAMSIPTRAIHKGGWLSGEVARVNFFAARRARIFRRLKI